MHQRKSSFRWISVMLMSVIVLNAVLFGAAGPVKAGSSGGLSAYNAAVTAAEMYQAITDYPDEIFETVQQKDSFYANRKADNDFIVDDLISKRPFATVTDLRDAYGSALDNRNFFLFLHEATDNSGVSAALSWVNDGTFVNPGLDLSKYSALDYTEQAVVDQAVLDGIPVNGYVAAFGIQTIIDATIGQIVAGALQEDKTALVIGYAAGDSAAHVSQNVTLPASGTHFTQITWTGGNGVIDPATGIVTPSSGGDVTAVLQAKISRNNEHVTKDFTLTVKSSAPPVAPPAITAHPQSTPLVFEGTPASFSVTATGTGLTYQWQVDIGSGFVNLPGDTNATLNIPAVSPIMNGYKYRVVVSGTGGLSVTSNEAVLNVLPMFPMFPPMITAHPQSTPLLLEGTPASFSVMATGTGLTYQWQEDSGMGFLNLQGETNATLNIPAVTQNMNGYTYRVVVSGTGGQQVTSNAAVLTVLPMIPTFPTVIMIHPQSTPPVLEGNPAAFSVLASGMGLTYQWQVNTGQGFQNLPGETNVVLDIPAVTLNMNGYTYRVVVSGTGGQTVTSNAAMLTVLPMIPIPTLPPVIVVHPQSPPPVPEGAPASFSVTATGAKLIYQWQEDNGLGFQDMPGETNATLNIAAVSQGMDGYRYRVVVTGKGGLQAISNDATLTVTQPIVPPVIKNQPPEDLSVPKGARINLSLSADGRDLSFQWQVNTGTGFHDLPGKTGSLLSIFPVTQEMNGNKYRVIVSASGLYPTTSDETLLTVYTVPSAPTNVTATAGNGQAVVSFTAPSDGGNAITGYEVAVSPGNKVVSGTAGPITVTGLANGTAYTFTVKALNAAGEGPASASSNAVTPYAPSSGGGGGGGSSESGTPTPTTPTVPEVPANDGADILVNGKTERAGTLKSSEVNGQSVLTIVVDPKKLDEKLASEGQRAVVTIPLAKDKKADVLIGELTGQMVKAMEQKQAVVKISAGDITYTIPAEQINVSALSDQLGKPAALDDIKVRIEVAAPSKKTLKIVENSASGGNFTLVAPAINFAVTGTYGGATVEVSRFNAYVERMIAIPDGVDPSKITTGVVVEADGTVRHVPTRIVNVGGHYFAKINSLTNSTYSVIWHPLEFRDVAGHWAQNAVNDMGSRMVINGVENGTFNPDTAITRAEFAAIMVRALGLKQENASTPFSDVKAGDWYSAAVQTAYAYKLIGGFEDGTFRPSDKITREQAMVIMAKAMKTTGLRDKLPSQEAAESLAPYADAAATADWAKSGVADCLQGAIFAGRTATELAPKASITRAEVAAIVQRLLQKSELI
ncbi:S-layer homology domain-containing protein [Paenibacillus chitinolyticus]|uniref:S-layer homology domain-containing protein n=1 Tax=Paenibacillus chitinolyticus TaxID=79263 RepID=UPI002DB61BB6|nr:S-layer homology domain-containing protein [Paenibacillus chitinolyticus]MEC0248348.1 S-layer homology domain-containing protein [Paenibacillus chitinolyticus]